MYYDYSTADEANTNDYLEQNPQKRIIERQPELRRNIILQKVNKNKDLLKRGVEKK